MQEFVFEELEHTADIGVRAGARPRRVFRFAQPAMFALLRAEPDDATPVETRHVVTSTRRTSRR